MDVTPELIDVANRARREAMAVTTIRKVEFPDTSAVWQIITVPDGTGLSYAAGGRVVQAVNVETFANERFARNAFDRIIMGRVLNAVANHLVKAQPSAPSQTVEIPGERG